MPTDATISSASIKGLLYAVTQCRADAGALIQAPFPQYYVVLAIEGTRGLVADSIMAMCGSIGASGHRMTFVSVPFLRLARKVNPIFGIGQQASHWHTITL